MFGGAAITLGWLTARASIINNPGDYPVIQAGIDESFAGKRTQRPRLLFY